MTLPTMDAPPTPAKTQLTREWFTERFTNHEEHSHHIRKTLVRTKTQFQEAVLADLYAFGRCLILDGEIQSAECDEFIYHEALVHPAIAAHGSARNALILGGGEGATARELLRHKSLRQITMVDIDGEVVSFCKRFLKSWHQGAFTDRRVQLVIDDAYKFIAASGERFDIILSDLPTPSGAGPIRKLYTVDFYKRLLERLNPGGILVVQAGSGSPLQWRFHAILARTLSKVFRYVQPYQVFIPSFDGPWAYLFCSQTTDPRHLSPSDIKRNLGSVAKSLRWYDEETHQGLFHMPKHLRLALQKERQIFRER